MNTFPMASRVNTLFRELVDSLQINSGTEPPFSVELTRELEDLRKIILNLLMAFLTLVISRLYQSVANSHMAAASMQSQHRMRWERRRWRFLSIPSTFISPSTPTFSSPTLTKFLHAIPLLGIFCMAVFKLMVFVQSPAIAACILLACTLPPLIIAVQFAKRCAEVILMPFPVQMRDVVPAMPDSADTTAFPS
ncbi:hypothetical protein JVT61DRAFT_6615 [Boletus reticuloceps]|uniref:Uncharacterized protein n=1 Tax=Boletus reticuloceps TaxID=495285 RepID=A0A8I2YLD3_9AGAM|nr:hypothetical protein JVT61DRAFT_6615 [Boletus reticuloceps]